MYSVWILRWHGSDLPSLKCRAACLHYLIGRDRSVRNSHLVVLCRQHGNKVLYWGRKENKSHDTRGKPREGTERGREATSLKRGQDDWDVYTFFHREFSRAFDFSAALFGREMVWTKPPPPFSNTCDTVIYHYLLLLRLLHLLHPFSHSWFFAFCCDLSVVERGREREGRERGNGGAGIMDMG